MSQVCKTQDSQRPATPRAPSDTPGASPRDAPGGVITRRAATAPFEVHLDVFSGPFELLLGLISTHKLDITEIALAKVTDEFAAHIRAQQGAQGWDLSQASEFLLVAATLLDLKASRLLPRTGEEEEDLELIEARDLLFARLLQYRAYKEVAAWVQERIARHGAMVPRQAGLEARFAVLLPELLLSIGPGQLAKIAATALTPKPPPTVGVAHLHAPTVSVRDQAGLLVARLREQRVASFAELVADSDATLVVVARFLALLELFRESAVTFEQEQALAELTVTWVGQEEEGTLDVGEEFDADSILEPDTEPDVVYRSAQSDKESRP